MLRRKMSARRTLLILAFAAMLLVAGNLFVQGIGMSFAIGHRNYWAQTLVVDPGPAAFLPTLILGIFFRRTAAVLIAISATISCVGLSMQPLETSTLLALFRSIHLPMLVTSVLLWLFGGKAWPQVDVLRSLTFQRGWSKDDTAK